jgi:hypothetical protein
MAIALIGALLPAVTGILDKLIPDAGARDRAKAEAEAALLAALAKADADQLAVNKAEAENSNIFVAGWRPFIGWVCGAALAYTYILVPLVMYVSFVIGKPLPKPPALDGNLYELMLGMLGMSGLRTFEKIKGAAK